MFYIYVLENENDRELYFGYTNNLKRRFEEHNHGKSFSTKKHNGRWILIYYESCVMESDARRREKYLKTTQGRRLIKRRLKDYFYYRKTH